MTRSATFFGRWAKRARAIIAPVTLAEAWPAVMARLREAACVGEQQWTYGVELGRAPLRHSVYTPLTKPLELRRLERKLGGTFPPPLREFYGKYANGLNVAGELVIFGLLRGGGSIDPYEPQYETVPADAAREYVYFGLLGPDNHGLYVDARDDRVHLSGLNSSDPLRSWPTFAEFLDDVVNEVLALFDADGRQTAEFPISPELAPPPPAPRRPLRVRPEFESALQRLLKELPDDPSELGEFVLHAHEDLGVEQVGFSHDPDGNELEGWPPSWLVVGYHKELGDPLIVDLADPAFPLYTAMVGSGSWDPEPVQARLPPEHASRGCAG